MRQQEAPGARPPAAAATEQATRQPNCFLKFLRWLLRCESVSGPSPPPLPSSAAREDQPRGAAAASGPTAAQAANPQEGARQPAPAAAAEEPPPPVPLDDSTLQSQTSSSTDHAAPFRQSSLREEVMKSRLTMLKGKGGCYKIEEAGSSIVSKSHQDCFPEFAPILIAPDAADTKRQAEGQRSSSSSYELPDSDNPVNAEESSAHAKPSSSSSVSEPKTEKEKDEEEKEEKEKDAAGN